LIYFKKINRFVYITSAVSYLVTSLMIFDWD